MPRTILIGVRAAALAALAAVALPAQACKRKAQPPTPEEDPGDGDAETPVNAPVTRIEADGTVYNVIEPRGEPTTLRRPEGIVPIGKAFACENDEAFEPTEPDPQPGFGWEDLRNIYPDMPQDKVAIVLDTEQGRAECEVWPVRAPQATANFIGLALGVRAWWHPCEHRWVRESPYYAGLRFHGVHPGLKVDAGCLYQNCEAGAGFHQAITEAGAPLNEAGLIIAPRDGPSGAFSLVDCQWRPTEPNKPLDGKCDLSPDLLSLASDWVAFGRCPHEGLSAIIYRLARTASDAHLDPRALHAIWVKKPEGGFYRYPPEQSEAPGAGAGGPAGGGMKAPDGGPTEEPTPQPATPAGTQPATEPTASGESSAARITRGSTIPR